MKRTEIFIVLNMVPERYKGVLELGYFTVVKDEKGDITFPESNASAVLLSNEEDEYWSELQNN